MQEIEKTIINAQQDANSVIAYSGFEYRKYQNRLYLLKKKVDPGDINEIDWKPVSPLILPGLKIQLTAVNRSGVGLKLELLNQSLKICFRKGGEYFHPVQRKHSQSLKKLLQEEGVPPWERGTFPLLFFNDELIAVIGLWISKQYAVDDNEDGWVIDVEVL